jgi:hypothetical protein
MTVYMVERDLKGITLEDLAAAQRRAIGASQRFSAQGEPVRYIRSVFVPGDGFATCLFEAANADIVKRVNEAAAIPFKRVVEALDLSP